MVKVYATFQKISTSIGTCKHGVVCPFTMSVLAISIEKVVKHRGHNQFYTQAAVVHLSTDGGMGG